MLSLDLPSSAEEGDRLAAKNPVDGQLVWGNLPIFSAKSPI